MKHQIQIDRCQTAAFLWAMIVACTNLIAAAGTLGKCWCETPDSSTVLFLCIDLLRPQVENELTMHNGKIFCFCLMKSFLCLQRSADVVLMFVLYSRLTLPWTRHYKDWDTETKTKPRPGYSDQGTTKTRTLPRPEYSDQDQEIEINTLLKPGYSGQDTFNIRV